MSSRVALCLQLLVLINAFIFLHSVKTWSSRPLFPSHKIPENALKTQRAVVRRRIVLYHNFFRTKVRPSASNMLLMSWHSGAARQAQQYADRCVFLQHNPVHENNVRRLGICGQNLFASSQKVPWFFAIKDWFLEYRNFTYGAPVRNLRAVGHYTQMTWAMSHKVGCGISFCRGGPWGHFYNYVCHYCPGGNVANIVQFPYKVGAPCGECPNHCVSGLCSNSCPARDFWGNCDELQKAHFPNFCEQTRGNCNATCTCGNRLHKNYPF